MRPAAERYGLSTRLDRRIQAIVDIGHLARTTTVAKFVANERVAMALRELGADYLQGFHVGHAGPVPGSAGGQPV